MQFSDLYKTIFLCFPKKITYKLNIASAMNKMTIKVFREYVYKNYYIWIGFTKENRYYSRKSQEKNIIIIRNQINWKYLIFINPNNIINLIGRKKQNIW